MSGTSLRHITQGQLWSGGPISSRYLKAWHDSLIIYMGENPEKPSWGRTLSIKVIQQTPPVPTSFSIWRTWSDWKGERIPPGLVIQQNVRTWVWKVRQVRTRGRWIPDSLGLARFLADFYCLDLVWAVQCVERSSIIKPAIKPKVSLCNFHCSDYVFRNTVIAITLLKTLRCSRGPQVQLKFVKNILHSKLELWTVKRLNDSRIT